MATYTPAKLVPIAALPNAAAAQYTAPANTSALVSRASYTNTDTVNRTVTVHIVPSGGSVATANKLISAQAIPPGKTWTPDAMIGRTLNPGDAIQAFASTAAVVNMVVDGYEIAL